MKLINIVHPKDKYVLPEDDYLRTVLPFIIPEHVSERAPSVVCMPLRNTLSKLKQRNEVSQDFTHKFATLSLGKTSQDMNCECNGSDSGLLATEEMTLLRVRRFLFYVLKLSEFKDCPLELEEHKGDVTLTCKVEANDGNKERNVMEGGHYKKRPIKDSPINGKHRRNQKIRRSRGKNEQRRDRGLQFSPSASKYFAHHVNNNVSGGDPTVNKSKQTKSRIQSKEFDRKKVMKLEQNGTKRGYANIEEKENISFTRNGQRVSTKRRDGGFIISAPDTESGVLCGDPLTTSESVLDSSSAGKFGAIGDGRKNNNTAMLTREQEEQEKHMKRQAGTYTIECVAV